MGDGASGKPKGGGPVAVQQHTTHNPDRVRGGKQARKAQCGGVYTPPHPIAPQNGPQSVLAPFLHNAVQLGATEGAQPLTAGEASERSESRRPSVAPKPAAPVLDTTAQLRQNAQTTLRKRARAKSLTEALTDGLVGLGESTPLRFAYRRTLNCAGVLYQSGAVVSAKYCNARWCVVCNRIRTAKLMVRYLPDVRGWKEPMLVTLTRPNVGAAQLHGEVRSVVATLRQVGQNVRRGDGVAFRAVRKLEVTYNYRRNDFHPHHHLLVDSRAAADALVKRWLEANPDANPNAQDVRPCTSPIELFKYVTKLVVKGLDSERTAPPPWALDNIFKALKGLRTVQPMGFKCAGAAAADDVVDGDGELVLDASTPAPLERTEPATWQWVSALYDWIDMSTGEVLADYSPDLNWLRLLARIRRDGAEP